MSLLQERAEALFQDLIADPPRISAYHDLPFAILRYDPAEEYPARKHIGLLATRLENNGRKVRFISIAQLMWDIISSSKGVNRIVQVEQMLGFDYAQRTISSLLSGAGTSALPWRITLEAESLDPATEIIFLVRAGALSPAIYQLSKLLDELKNKTSVPVILFYPGSIDGNTGLKFMDLGDRDAIGNYRVKIY
jgi:hypothetical protein